MMPPEILLIDDDAHASTLRKRVLEFKGYRVQLALEGASGIHLAEALKPALVMFDHQLPGMCGPELMIALRAILPDTPLVSLSGHESLCGQYPVQPDAYLTKGNPVPDMLRLVASLIH